MKHNEIVVLYFASRAALCPIYFASPTPGDNRSHIGRAQPVKEVGSIQLFGGCGAGTLRAEPGPWVDQGRPCRGDPIEPPPEVVPAHTARHDRPGVAREPAILRHRTTLKPDFIFVHRADGNRLVHNPVFIYIVAGGAFRATHCKHLTRPGERRHAVLAMNHWVRHLFEQRSDPPESLDGAHHFQKLKFLMVLERQVCGHPIAEAARI